MSNIERKIDNQVAHIMANYGDDGKEFMIKMNQLVLEWYHKGLADARGIEIVCPHCQFEITVYHAAWESIICPNLNCRKQID